MLRNFRIKQSCKETITELIHIDLVVSIRSFIEIYGKTTKPREKFTTYMRIIIRMGRPNYVSNMHRHFSMIPSSPLCMGF